MSRNNQVLKATLLAVATTVITGCGGGGGAFFPTPIQVTTGTGAGVPARLVFSTQPQNTTTGSPISGVQVTIEDVNGNVVATSADAITISIATDPTGGQAVLSGTTTVNATSGIATFNNLSIGQTVTGNEAFTLQAIDATTTSLAATTSGSFTESPSGATNVSILAGQNNASIAGGTLTPASAGNVNGTGVGASFSSPKGIAVDSHGNTFVADQGNGEIRMVSSSGVVTTVLSGLTAGASPTAVCIDIFGNLFFTDSAGNKVDEIPAADLVAGNTVFVVVAGNGTAGHVDHLDPLTSEFSGLTGIGVDAADNLFVAEKGNNDVREIVSSGPTSALVPGGNGVLTFAGNGTAGFANATVGNATITAEFNQPFGIAVISGQPVLNGSDLDGDSDTVFVADRGNNAVRELVGSGLEATGPVVTTLAGGGSGNPGTAGDVNGAASVALFSGPTGVAVDTNGNVFVAETGNNDIRLISGVNGSSPTVSLVSGSSTGTAGFVDGTLVTAQYAGPGWVAIAGNGTLLVSEATNNRIRQLSGFAAPLQAIPFTLTPTTLAVGVNQGDQNGNGDFTLYQVGSPLSAVATATLSNGGNAPRVTAAAQIQNLLLVTTSDNGKTGLLTAQINVEGTLTQLTPVAVADADGTTPGANMLLVGGDNVQSGLLDVFVGDTAGNIEVYTVSKATGLPTAQPATATGFAQANSLKLMQIENSSSSNEALVAVGKDTQGNLAMFGFGVTGGNQPALSSPSVVHLSASPTDLCVSSASTTTNVGLLSDATSNVTPFTFTGAGVITLGTPLVVNVNSDTTAPVGTSCDLASVINGSQINIGILTTSDTTNNVVPLQLILNGANSSLSVISGAASTASATGTLASNVANNFTATQTLLVSNNVTSGAANSMSAFQITVNSATSVTISAATSAATGAVPNRITVGQNAK